jgi:hypothetical protein
VNSNSMSQHGCGAMQDKHARSHSCLVHAKHITFAAAVHITFTAVRTAFTAVHITFTAVRTAFTAVHITFTVVRTAFTAQNTLLHAWDLVQSPNR